MVDTSAFQIISKRIDLDSSKKVSYMQVVIEANDCGKTAGSTNSDVPAVYFTDIMLQGGTVATSWVGHVSEIRWSFDNA